MNQADKYTESLKETMWWIKGHIAAAAGRSTLGNSHIEALYRAIQRAEIEEQELQKKLSEKQSR